jgi:hypothetical protein
MSNEEIRKEDIKDYLELSKEIADRESTLYESDGQLSHEEFKINDVVAEQNKIRFDKNEEDLFRIHLETVIRLLADNFEEFGFEHDLYYDLVYNLMVLEYDRLDQIGNEERVAFMLKEIGINEHIRQKVKALLDHEIEVGEMKPERESKEE